MSAKADITNEDYFRIAGDPGPSPRVPDTVHSGLARARVVIEGQ